jgi:hypothetical protein
MNECYSSEIVQWSLSFTSLPKYLNQHQYQHLGRHRDQRHHQVLNGQEKSVITHRFTSEIWPVPDSNLSRKMKVGTHKPPHSESQGSRHSKHVLVKDAKKTTPSSWSIPVRLLGHKQRYQMCYLMGKMIQQIFWNDIDFPQIQRKLETRCWEIRQTKRAMWCQRQRA